MPWIHVVLPAGATPERPELPDLPQLVAGAAAEALDLQPSDVVVLVTPAVGSSGRGALAYVTGRRRSADQEARLGADVRSALAAAAALDPELVSVVRL